MTTPKNQLPSGIGYTTSCSTWIAMAGREDGSERAGAVGDPTTSSTDGPAAARASTPASVIGVVAAP